MRVGRIRICDITDKDSLLLLLLLIVCDITSKDSLLLLLPRVERIPLDFHE